jgi:hypothetical protein
MAAISTRTSRCQPQPDSRARARACVLHRVRQSFLDEPEDNQLNAGRRVPGRVLGFSTGVQKDIPYPRSLSGWSGVAAVQSPGGQGGQHDRVAAQARESGPRAQRMRAGR